MSPSAARTCRACLAAVSPTPYRAMIPLRDGTLAPGASVPPRIWSRRSSSTRRYTGSFEAPMGLDLPDDTARLGRPSRHCGSPAPEAVALYESCDHSFAGPGGGTLLLPGEDEAVADREHRE